MQKYPQEIEFSPKPLAREETYCQAMDNFFKESPDKISENISVTTIQMDASKLSNL